MTTPFDVPTWMGLISLGPTPRRGPTGNQWLRGEGESVAFWDECLDWCLNTKWSALNVHTHTHTHTVMNSRENWETRM